MNRYSEMGAKCLREKTIVNTYVHTTSVCLSRRSCCCGAREYAHRRHVKCWHAPFALIVVCGLFFLMLRHKNTIVHPASPLTPPSSSSLMTVRMCEDWVAHNMFWSSTLI